MIIQTLLAGTSEAQNVLSCLDRDAVKQINWNSNPGNVIELLASSLGLAFSKDGKKLWRAAEPSAKLKFVDPKAANTRAPKLERDTILGRLASLDLVHDSDPAAMGRSRAAQAAAREARPAAPRTLPIARPDAIDRISRGTGYGSVPRALSESFVTELTCVDALAVWIHDHARSCGKELQRVHAEQPHWSCHSVGLVGIIRLQCADGCCLTWSSASHYSHARTRETLRRLGHFSFVTLWLCAEKSDY